MHTGMPWHSSLHALCYKPDLRFTDQKEGETILLSMRAHLITLVPVIFNIFVIMLLMMFFNFTIFQFLDWFTATYINIFFLIFLFLHGWILFTNWYFTVVILINQQIIDIDFNIVLSKGMTRTSLSSIKDIIVKISGFFPGICNYGNIFIQTAGTQINTEFIAIPTPGQAGQVIQEALRQYGKSK